MRITAKNLESLIGRINLATKSPLKPWYKDNKGKLHANVGCYYIDQAYGGNKLARIVNDGGGIKEITHGFVSKRELYKQMQAFLIGLETGAHI